jgi:hypothetical protein
MKGNSNANFLLRFANNVLGYGRYIGFFLVAFTALIFNQSFASSSIYLPSFSGFSGGTFNAHALNLSQNWGVKSGYFWQSADTGSLAFTSRMSAAEGQALYSAVGGAAAVSQIGAKSALVSGLKAGISGGIPAILLSLAATYGLQYISNQWMKTTGLPAHTQYVFSSSSPYTPHWGDTLSAAASDLVAGEQAYYNSPSQWNGRFSETLVSVNQTNLTAIISVCTPYGCNNQTIGPASTRAASSTLTNVPAVDSDWSALSNMIANLSDDQLKAMAQAGISVPVGQTNTVIGDFSALSSTDLQFLQNNGYFTSPNGSNFPMDSPYTDPVSGQSSQTMVNVQAGPGGSVNATTYDTPLNADGTPQKDANGNPVKQANTDPCSSNPGSLACTSLGIPSGTGPSATTSAVTITPVAVNMPGVCPAPVTFTTPFGQASISYDAVCSYASYIKPVVILLGTFFAGLIFVGGLKTS